MENSIKTIIKIVKSDLRTSKYHKIFYLSEVELDDHEVYSLAGSHPPTVGEFVEAYFDDFFQKPKASYPKKSP